jgi:hypothetical protein
VRRPAFWIVFLLLSAAAAYVAVRFFPQAFSIVALEITMDRERAMAEARTIMTRDQLGPSGYRQAASFTLDSEAQTFIELEGGGKGTFTSMLREGLYSAYTWRVRQFKEGETQETTIRFTPEGRPYGFEETLREDAPGAALEAAAAKEIAERGAARWNVDLGRFQLVEQGQERRAAGRIDHTLTYERPTPTLNEGRYRVRLVVSGDRLTEVTYFIQIPEAFTRRYASMRSANEAIGIASVVGMALLYVFGGIGVGLFFMMRERWLIWRPAVFWGAAVGIMQALTMVNDLPLRWMDYDTAIARSTFLAEHAARVVASFVGFTAFFALSFMAAETLTRRAFGHHPRLWRAWSARPADGGPTAPGASFAILGRTVGGYLLVPVFLAYVVMFYFVATRYLGWWSPSESLLHPDVLAHYVPWLSAIANSFQAGFWEEALFRAVPLAGAALIGDRLGHRRSALAVAFVVQALIFGAGHAPYPGQPSYARPVELIIPSIGFGLIYLFFGLLPAIVLHFTFDVLLFALPIFLAHAPRIWLQQAMVVVMALLPLWIVLVRRMQVGRWTELSPADRNATWTPPQPVERIAKPLLPHPQLSARASTRWLAVGSAAFLLSSGVIGSIGFAERQDLPITRERAVALTRQEIEGRGVSFDRRWRFLSIPDNGSDATHEFVSSTAGEARRRELLGRYLPMPRWRVRVATFEGDVADRAEEWNAYVTATGEVRGIRHTLPEARAGAALDEETARQLARKTVRERFNLDAARGEIREVSAQPTRHQARTDWTFVFVDTTIAPLPRGEPRISVAIAGDEIASAGRFVFVPDEWERQARANSTRNIILRILGAMVFAGLLLGAAVSGVIAWSRRRYTPRLFFVTAVLMFVVSISKSGNNWPALLASLSTEAPLELQLLGAIGLGLVGLLLNAALVGLALGAVPQRLAGGAVLPDRDALRLAAAAGFFAAAVAIIAAWIRTPEWARLPNLEPAGTMNPIFQVAIDPLTRVLMASAIMLPALILVDQVTSAWTRRRLAGVAILVVIGFAAGGVPAGASTSGWVAGAAIMAAALVIGYVTLLRFDLTTVPMALGTMAAIGALVQGAQRAYPGALIGSLAASLLAIIIGWRCTLALRRARARIAADVQAHAGVAVSRGLPDEAVP